MVPAEKLLLTYQHVFALSKQMLVLATGGKWDALIDMEITYIHAVESTLQPDMPLFTIPQQDLLKRTLSAILENECEIRRLLQQRMEDISKQLLNQTKRQKAVNAAYGQSSEYPLLSGDSQ